MFGSVSGRYIFYQYFLIFKHPLLVWSVVKYMFTWRCHVHIWHRDLMKGRQSTIFITERSIIEISVWLPQLLLTLARWIKCHMVIRCRNLIIWPCEKNDTYLRDYLNERARIIISMRHSHTNIFDLPISYERLIIHLINVINNI